MLQPRQVFSIDELHVLKEAYLLGATAPLDGMWLHGFVPMATHYGLFEGGELGGFYCVDGDGRVLQFMVTPTYGGDASAVFASVVGGGEVQGAFASTAEPAYLSLCLDHFARFEVHALMYQRDPTQPTRDEPVLPLRGVSQAQLPEAVAFAVEAIGAPEAWLEGYYAKLIASGELFGLWEAGRLVATGESRRADRVRHDTVQTDCADLGVVVAESERGRGLARQILKDLVSRNEREGLRSICSTERGNVAAQRAITRSGFVAPHRIVRFDV